MIRTLANLHKGALDGLGAGICLAMLGGAFAVGVLPTLDKRAAAARDRETLLAEQQAAHAVAAEVKRAELARDQLKAMQQDDFKLEAAGRINSRIARLTDLAARERLIVRQVEPGAVKPEPGKQFVVVPIRVKGSGEFADCVAFLHQLRAQHRDIAVPSVNLTIEQPASENQAAVLEVSLELAWYAAADDSAGATEPRR